LITVKFAVAKSLASKAWPVLVLVTGPNREFPAKT
jgi:hypothetical protein